MATAGVPMGMEIFHKALPQGYWLQATNGYWERGNLFSIRFA